jgi:hypothetical protein
MKKKSFSLFVLIISLIATCLVAGCGNTTSASTIAQIDKEETYPESPGQLEVTYSSISEIIADATCIAKVSVLDQSVETLDGYPQTHTTVQILESYKGDIKADEKIEIIEEGGQDNKVMGGIPQMSDSNEYILFLTEYNEI